MDIRELYEKNMIALIKTSEFRQKAEQMGIKGFHPLFHEYKNSYLYFGFIEVTVIDKTFLMFSANDDLVAMTYFWYGPSSYENKSMTIWHKFTKEVSVIYDIGAFTGVYSLVAAANNPTSSIYSFEPVRRTYSRLLLNIQVNRLKNITPVNKAILDKKCEIKIKQYRGEHVLGAGASVIDKGIPVCKEDEIVFADSLDNMVTKEKIPYPELIKIDIEGAEDMAINGMMEILSNKRPILIIENWPKNFNHIVNILKDFNYELYEISEQTNELFPFKGEKIPLSIYLPSLKYDIQIRRENP